MTENGASELFSTWTQTCVIALHNISVKSTFQVIGSRFTVVDATGFPLVREDCSAILSPLPTSLLLPNTVTFQKFEPVTSALVAAKVTATPTAGEFEATPSTTGPPLVIATAESVISTPVFNEMQKHWFLLVIIIWEAKHRYLQRLLRVRATGM